MSAVLETMDPFSNVFGASRGLNAKQASQPRSDGLDDDVYIGMYGGNGAQVHKLVLSKLESITEEQLELIYSEFVQIYKQHGRRETDALDSVKNGHAPGSQASERTWIAYGDGDVISEAGHLINTVLGDYPAIKGEKRYMVYEVALAVAARELISPEDFMLLYEPWGKQYGGLDDA